MEKLWQLVKSNLEERLHGLHVSCWFQDTQIASEGPESVIVYVPNKFSQKWIQDNYLSHVVEEIRSVTGRQLKVSLAVRPGGLQPSAAESQKDTDRDGNGDPRPASSPPAPGDGGATPPRVTQAPGPSCAAAGRGLNRKYRFSTFVVGASNRFAWTAAQEVCRRFEPSYNPLCVYSPAGLGKTHLGQAVGHFLGEKDRRLRIRWSSAEAFCAEMMQQLRNKTLSAFKQKYREECDVFCLDDVHFLKGKKWIQTELCYTLDALVDQGKQVLLFGQIAPNDTEGFSEGLTSRMFSGLTARIYPPEKETRIEILRLLASQSGVSVPDSSLEIIADAVTAHIRNLEGAFTRVVAMSSLLKRPIDQELVAEALKDFKEKRGALLTLEDISRHVGCYFQIDREALAGRSRKQRVYYCRQIAMYLSRKHTGESLQAIGLFYHRDHASVFHALRSLEQKMKVSARVRREVAFLEETLLERHGT